MQITNHNDAIVITNPDPEYMRLVTIRAGLRLEIKTGGKMKLTRGPMCSTLARQMGFKGNREKQLIAIEARLMQLKETL